MYWCPAWTADPDEVCNQFTATQEITVYLDMHGNTMDRETNGDIGTATCDDHEVTALDLTGREWEIHYEEAMRAGGYNQCNDCLEWRHVDPTTELCEYCTQHRNYAQARNRAATGYSSPIRSTWAQP